MYTYKIGERINYSKINIPRTGKVNTRATIPGKYYIMQKYTK